MISFPPHSSFAVAPFSLHAGRRGPAATLEGARLSDPPLPLPPPPLCPPGQAPDGGEDGATFRPSAPIYSVASGRHVAPAAFGLALPDGWAECPNFGTPIRGIIPSKVPLSRRFLDRLPPESRYGPSEALDAFAAHGASVGLVIDLTFTTRYSDPAEWEARGVRVVKLACRGREGPPDPESVNVFCHVLSNYEKAEAFAAAAEGGRRPRFALVHCTHGFNRTGAMIVHYLMRNSSSAKTPYPTLPSVLAQFSEVRPPGIYKPDYLDMLFAYYHEARPAAAACPPLPPWKAAEAEAAAAAGAGRPPGDDDVPADDLFGPGNADYGRTPAVSPYPPPSATDEPPPYAPPPSQSAGARSIAHDEVLGEGIAAEEEADMQAALEALIAPQAVAADGQPPWRGAGAPKPYYPGSQPVSLASVNMDMLGSRRQAGYLICALYSHVKGGEEGGGCACVMLAFLPTCS